VLQTCDQSVLQTEKPGDVDGNQWMQIDNLLKRRNRNKSGNPKTRGREIQDWSSDGVVFFFGFLLKQTLLADGRQEIYLHTTGFKPVLGGYHNFMIPSGPVLPKYGTRRIRFSLQTKILHWVKVSTFDFLNFKPVLTMPVLRSRFSFASSHKPGITFFN
jgi:hypothetical protein